MRISNTWTLPSAVFLVLLLQIPAYGAITVEPISPSPFLELGSSQVDFKVTNTELVPMILDYALAIINGPQDDDKITFTTVSFPTILAPNGGMGTFSYGITNFPQGDPTDPDTGLSRVSFYVAMSPALAGSIPQFITDKGLGFFVHLATGGSAGVGPDAATLAILNGCFNAPGGFPNPCPNIGANHLYRGEIQGQPFPAVANVTVVDTPEPGTLSGFLMGGLILAGLGVRRSKAFRS